VSKKGLKFVNEKFMKEIFASFALRSLLVIYGDTHNPKKEYTIPRSCEWKSLDADIDDVIFLWLNWIFGKVESSVLFD
jgi:hypothetical protein